MLIKVFGFAIYGIDAVKITVEVNITKGIGFNIVGLPDSAVKESYKRIETALKNNEYTIPGKSITINMAPANIRKEGSAYDLTIASGILAASEQISADKVSDYIIMGELALDGLIRPIRGALPITIQAKKEGFKGVIVPKINVAEASVVDGIEVYGIEHIKELIAFLDNKSELKKYIPSHINDDKSNNYINDFKDIKGQESVKRAIEVAATGGHNVLLIGPPGAGKTMIAKSIPSILPPLNNYEALETTKIYSVSGKIPESKGLIKRRPFRAPHHTISNVALVGGGSTPRIGEISLAHNGILFLDELPEFKRDVLEVLRQPLEERIVSISRANFSITYPASIMLVASMNPCPCGFYTHPTKDCTCNYIVVQKYLNRISGPLLDRIDIHIEVSPVDVVGLINDVQKNESSCDISKRVQKNTNVQLKRFNDYNNISYNSQMTPSMLNDFCKLGEIEKKILEKAMDKLQLSARAYNRILKVSRTIADMDDCETIKSYHLAEAIQYRSLDKGNWGMK